MPNWIPLVAATVAAVPAAAAFFWAYGRYDGAFNDRTVFLYFIGGLAVGALLGFLSLLFFNSGGLALVQVIILALLYPIALVATINRRKWQGERHAVFNGGSAGLGVGMMLSFSFLYFRLQAPYQAALQPLVDAWKANKSVGPAPVVNTVPYAFDWLVLGQGVLLSVGFAGIFFGMGLLAGEGVRRKRQFVVALTGTAILLAPVVFLEEFAHTLVWLWAALLAAYGLIFGFVAEKKLLIEGVTVEERKARRRRRKAALR